MYVFILSLRKKIFFFSLQVEFSTLWKAEQIFKVLLVKANFLSVLQLAPSSLRHHARMTFVFFKHFPESGVGIGTDPPFCHCLCWYQNKRIMLRVLLHMWKISGIKSFVAPEEAARNIINYLQLHCGHNTKVCHQQIRHLFFQLSSLLQRCRPASSRGPPSATPSRSRTS